MTGRPRTDGSYDEDAEQPRTCEPRLALDQGHYHASAANRVSEILTLEAPDAARGLGRPGPANPLLMGAAVTDTAGENAEAATVHMASWVTVKAHGAAGDGIADDTEAFNSAMSAVARKGGVVVVPAGTYKITSTIAVPSNVYLVGESAMSTTLLGCGTDLTILSVGNGSTNPNHVLIQDLSFTYAAQQSSSAAIRVRNGHVIRIKAVRFIENGYCGVMLDGGLQQYNYFVEEYFFYNSWGIGIWIGGNSAGICQNVHLGKGTIAGCAIAGVYVEHCGGLYATNGAEILRCQRGLHVAPNSGEEAIWIQMQGLIVDTCTQDGIILAPLGSGRIRGVQFTHIWCSSNGANGTMAFAGLSMSGAISGVQINGGTFVNNGGHGIVVHKAEDVNISNAYVVNNSCSLKGAHHGISFGSDVCNFSVIGGKCGGAPATLGGQENRQGYGIHISFGASNRYRIIGVDVSGNVLGGVHDGATGLNKYVVGNLE